MAENWRSKLISRSTLVLLLALVLAFVAGLLLRPWLDMAYPAGYPLLSEVIDLLQQRGLKPVPEGRELEYGLIRGALQAYNDPFTTFVEPAQNELQSNDLEGKFGGIGVRIERDEAGTVFLFPYPDSPAAVSGVQDGDLLVWVEDLVVQPDTPIDQIQAVLRGPVGQAVRFGIRRPPDTQDIALTARRAEVPLPSLTWNLSPDEPRIGVIQVNIIAASTPDEIEKAAADLQSRGAAYLVLDLRNNGGGLLDAGIDTARLFLREGVVITQQYRGQAVKEYRVEKPGALADLPVAVFINGGTASAAEIIAGALQVSGRAALVGTRTYGKDSIQLVFTLKDGSSLHVTSARWWLPGRETGIAGQGLSPDIEVPDDAQHAGSMLQTAKQLFGLQ